MRVTFSRHATVALALGVAAIAFAAPGEMSLARGISVQIPDGWRVAEAWESARSKSSQEYSDPTVAKRILEPDATETLVVLAKHSAEHLGFNPSIQISRTPLPLKLKGIKPDKLIEFVLPGVTHAFHDVKIEAWKPDITVSGRPAAQATATYAVHAKSGRVIPARTSFVVVVDGDGFFLIGMSSPAAGEDDARTEFQHFIAQLKLPKTAV